MDDVLTLVAPALERNDLGDYVPAGEETRDIFGTVRSVTRAEWYAAGREGLRPDLVFVTPLVNYAGEPEADYRGNRYAVYRTYFDGGDEIELYLQRKAGVQHGHQD